MTLCEPGRTLISKTNARMRLTLEPDSSLPDPNATGPAEPQTIETPVTLVLFNDLLLLLVTDVVAQMVNAGLRLLTSAVGLRSSGSSECFNYFAHYALENVVFELAAPEVAINTGLTREFLVFPSESDASAWFATASDALRKRKELCFSLKARTSGQFKLSDIGIPQ